MFKLFALFQILSHTLNAVTNAENNLATQPGATKKQAALTAAVTAAQTIAGDVLTPDKSAALTGALGGVV